MSDVLLACSELRYLKLILSQGTHSHPHFDDEANLPPSIALPYLQRLILSVNVTHVQEYVLGTIQVPVMCHVVIHGKSTPLDFGDDSFLVGRAWAGIELFVENGLQCAIKAPASVQGHTILQYPKDPNYASILLANLGNKAPFVGLGVLSWRLADPSGGVMVIDSVADWAAVFRRFTGIHTLQFQFNHTDARDNHVFLKALTKFYVDRDLPQDEDNSEGLIIPQLSRLILLDCREDDISTLISILNVRDVEGAPKLRELEIHSDSKFKKAEFPVELREDLQDLVEGPIRYAWNMPDAVKQFRLGLSEERWRQARSSDLPLSKK
jgi:hypothetical protein